MNDLEYLDGRVMSFAQSEEHPDQYVGRVVICDFSTNKNNVRLNRDNADECVATMVHEPFVGKVVATRAGVYDFTGHNPRVKLVTNADGKMTPHYEFDTSAFGTFTNCSIEEVDGTECIVADFVAWKRFERACEVLCRRVAEGTLNTSWEISYDKEDCQMISEDGNPNPVKLLNKWAFTGHCALGKNVSPAYDSSRVLDVAEEEDDEFASALIAEVACAEESGKEDNALQKEDMATEVVETAEEQIVEEVAEEAVPAVSEEASEEAVEATAEEAVEDAVPADEQAEGETEAPAEGEEIAESEAPAEETSEVEQSAMTQRDIMRRLYIALEQSVKDFYDIYAYFPEDHVVWVKQFGTDELVVAVVQFSVDGEEVVINSVDQMQLVAVPIELNGMASEQKQTIEELQSQVAELAPYKEQIDKQNHDAAEQKLRKRASAAKCFTEQELESDAFAEMFASLDANRLNEMIVERTVVCEEVASTVADKAVEMSDLRNFDTDPNPANGVRRWLSKR